MFWNPEIVDLPDSEKGSFVGEMAHDGVGYTAG
jgi:hypothetical protein